METGDTESAKLPNLEKVPKRKMHELFLGKHPIFGQCFGQLIPPRRTVCCFLLDEDVACKLIPGELDDFAELWMELLGLFLQILPAQFISDLAMI